MAKPDAASRHIAGEPATSGLPAEISLQLGAQHNSSMDIFGGAVEEDEEKPEDNEELAAAEGDEDVPQPKKKGKGRGRGAGEGSGGSNKARAGSLSGKSQLPREENCPLFCREYKIILPKQRGCEECYRDLEAMRRDALASGPKARKF